jgi:DNA-binding response OmpR family regulator
MAWPSPERRRITVVEDDASLRSALAFALEAEGYAVAVFAAAEPLLAAPPPADCLVVDLRLPGMDGLALIAALRTLGAQPPAILITSNPDQRRRDAAAAAKVEIVEKPLVTAELRLRIARVIARNS